MTNDELYQEENREILIKLGKSVNGLKESIDQHNKLYKPPLENVSVNGEVTVNTEKSVDINNMTEFAEPVTLLATPITAASGNVVASSAVATLAGTAGKTTYITGFQITSSGATVGLIVNPTIVGTISGTLTYVYAAMAGALLINTPLIVNFPVPIPASAVNTAIVVTLPTLGLGNTNSCVVAHGYQL